MRLYRQYNGTKKTVFLLVLDDGSCPARTFLETLKATNEGSHKAMIRRIKSHADIGYTSIQKHGHPIKGRKALFVWKTHQGARLLYFEGNVGTNVVVTHGYNKGDPERAEYDKAERLRDACLTEGGR
ncbi:MAG: hypothetical protein HY669_03640 [Chloroflexi bacterium]|nr:hypothetical protein [Chloroflexota bacterium]